MTAQKSLSALDQNSQKIVNLADPTSAQDGATKNYVDTGVTSAENRANHTGTQLANTISNFDTQVRTSSLNQMTAPTTDLSIAGFKLTNVATPTLTTDAAPKGYVDTALSSLTSGLILKGSVRAATSSNVTITGPGTTIDGLTAVSGDVFILMGQTTASQNGPWTYTGSGTAMTRPSNFASGSTGYLGAFWDVREGTNADTFALLTNDASVTVDTTSLAFVIRGGTTAVRSYTTTCPATSAGAGWLVTHNLNSRYVHAQVARTASPYDFVNVRIERTSVNTVTVQSDIALASGEYEIMICLANGT